MSANSISVETGFIAGKIEAVSGVAETLAAADVIEVEDLSYSVAGDWVERRTNRGYSGARPAIKAGTPVEISFTVRHCGKWYRDHGREVDSSAGSLWLWCARDRWLRCHADRHRAGHRAQLDAAVRYWRREHPRRRGLPGQCRQGAHAWSACCVPVPVYGLVCFASLRLCPGARTSPGGRHRSRSWTPTSRRSRTAARLWLCKRSVSIWA